MSGQVDRRWFATDTALEVAPFLLFALVAGGVACLYHFWPPRPAEAPALASALLELLPRGSSLVRDSCTATGKNYTLVGCRFDMRGDEAARRAYFPTALEQKGWQKQDVRFDWPRPDFNSLGEQRHELCRAGDRVLVAWDPSYAQVLAAIWMGDRNGCPRP